MMGVWYRVVGVGMVFFFMVMEKFMMVFVLMLDVVRYFLLWLSVICLEVFEFVVIIGIRYLLRFLLSGEEGIDFFCVEV